MNQCLIEADHVYLLCCAEEDIMRRGAGKISFVVSTLQSAAEEEDGKVEQVPSCRCRRLP